MVIVLLLLLVGGAVWLHFSDKACCCLKDKVRACKTRSSGFIKRKCCKKRQQQAEMVSHGFDGVEDSSRVALKDTPNKWIDEAGEDIEM